MIAGTSAFTFKGECAFVRKYLRDMLHINRPLHSYRALLRALAERLHAAVMEFGKTYAFDVYEEEYTYAFDALAHLWDALAGHPIQTPKIKLAYEALEKVSSEGGGA